MMILHTIDYSNAGYRRVIVKCDDTDVLVLLLYYYMTPHINNNMEIYCICILVIKTRKDNVPIHTIVQKLGQQRCAALPAVHA